MTVSNILRVDNLQVHCDWGVFFKVFKQTTDSVVSGHTFVVMILGLLNTLYHPNQFNDGDELESRK